MHTTIQSEGKRAGGCQVQQRRSSLAATILALFICALPSGAQTITRVSAPGKYYVDDKAGIGVVFNYAAYMISNNTATTLSNVYVVATNFVSTNMVKLAVSDTGVRALGAITPGQSKMAAFYLRGPSFTGVSDTLLNVSNENHTIRVLDGAPGIGSALVSANFGFTNIIFVTEALANKITLITNLNPYAVLGSEVTMVIGGDTGTIGGENSISFSPAVLGSWRPDAYELVGAKVVFTENPTYTNQLYFDPTIPGFTNYTGQIYTNTMTFRAVRVTGTNIAISPFAFIDSGSSTKHTAFTSLASAGGSNVIYSATNTVSIVSQTVSPTSLFAPGGTVTYAITFSNYANIPITLNEIIDTLPGVPANATYVPGSAMFSSNGIPDPFISGQVLRWARPFLVPSNNFAVLTFQAIAPLPAGNYTNSVVALNGSEQVDTTTLTTDNSPSLSVFTIIPVADVGVSKSSPTSVLAGNNFNYTITVTNLGPSPASGLSVTDSLPANVTFVSASAGGVFSGGQVIWTGLPTLAANVSTNLIVTVTAPPQGMTLTNTARGGSPILDPNSTNNVTPPVVTDVTPNANLSITKSGPATAVAPGANFDYAITVANLGPSTAVSVTVTDALPANVTFVSASASGVFSGGSVIWNLGNMIAGASTNLALTVASPLKGSATNIASTGSSTLDTNLVNNTTPPVTTTVSNVPPVAVNDAVGTPRNVAVTVPATLNDSDANGDALTITLVNPTNGTANIVNGTNVFFTPTTNFMGSATVGYTISDGFGGTASALITINVTNRPPVAVNDSTTGTNGVPQVINPLVNDTDADGDALTITNVVAVNGIVTINAGNTNVTFTPTNDNTGTITYTISDGFGGSATAVITVIGLNSAPVANDDSATTAVNVPVTIPATANDTDVNGDPLSIISVSATNGTASIVNGTNVLFTPNTNFDGTAYVTYTITDGQGGNATGLITITVTPVADVSISKSSPATVAAANSFNYIITVLNAGPSASGSLSVTDSLPAGVTFASASAGGMLVGNQVLWTNLATLAANTSTNLILTVTAPADVASLTNFASVGGPVSDPNLTNNVTPPVITSVTPVADLAITKTGPGASPLPGANFNYTITVANFGPSIAASVTVTDALPANLTFVGASAGGVFSGGQVIWSNLGSLAAGGSTNLTLTVTAPLKGSITNIASVGGPTGDPNPTNNVTPPVTINVSNLPPVAVNDTASTPKNVAVTVPVLANDSDPNGDSLTITLVSPTNGTALISGSSVVFTPGAGFLGNATCGYTISDSNGGTASALITISVTNRVPVANNQNVSTPEDTALPITLTGSDPDSDTLTFSIVSGPSSGAISGFNTNTGALTYTPGTNFNGSDSFTFRVNDGTADSPVATVNVTVTPVNDAPFANDQNVSTPEDTPKAITLTGSDVEGSALTFSIVSGPSNGSISGFNPGTGALTYTPSTNFNGGDSFTFRVNDGTDNSAPATVNITVTPVNDPPIVSDDSATTPEDTPVTVPVLVNDSDPDGDPLTLISAVTTNGTASVVGTNVVYTPAPNFFGTTYITYTVIDGNGGTNSATIVVTVTPVNDAPVANGQSLTTPEDTALPITLTGSDIEGSPLTFAVVGGPANGAISGFNTNTGVLTYTPNANFNGSDSFTFRVNDGAINSAVATVNITVTPVNDAPVANNQSVTTPEDTAKSITLTGSDVEGSALTFSVLSGPASGVISGFNANSGALSYTPNGNFNGSDSFTFRVNDGTSDSAPATVSITVTPVNDAPVANNDTNSTPRNVPVTLLVLANDFDVDGDSLTITNAAPTNGIVSIIGGTNLYFTPSSNYMGTASIGYTITDGNGGSASAVAYVLVTLGTNTQPVAVNDSVSTPEDTARQFDPRENDFDADGDPLTISSASTTNGTVTVLGGTNVVFTPAPNFNGTVFLTYTINDGMGGSATATITVTVTPVNDAPVANGQSVTTPEDTALPITLTGSDVDGNSLTFAIISGPASGVISGFNTNAGALTYTPGPNFNGADSFTFRVNDGTANSATATVSITVTPVNDAPVANNLNVNTPEDVPLPITLTGSDVEGSPLTFALVGSPTNGTLSGFNPASGAVTYTPNSNFNGADAFTFRVSDGTNNSATALVTITVIPVNDAPVANNQSVSTPEDTALPITLTGSDVEGSPLTFALVANPVNGTLSGFNPNTGALVYTPNANFNGSDSLTFRVSDGSTNSAVATVSITVTPVNDAPVANNQSVSTPEDTALPITLTGSDTEGSALTFALVGSPANGVISGFNSASGASTYTPNANFNGSDSFTFRVNDGTNDSAVATVTINVTPVNDPPVANNQSVSTPEETPKAITLSGSDTEGTALTYILVSGPANGALSGFNTNTGALTYTPAPNFNGSDSFTFRVSDGTNLSATATVSITITPVNDAPVANNQSVSTPEDTALPIALTGSDVDGNPLTFALVSGPANGAVSGFNASTGTLTYTPNTNYNGADSFTFRVSDGVTNSSVATVSISVTPVTDPPIIINDFTNTPSGQPVVVPPLVNDIDPDGNGLALSCASATNGTVVISGTNVIFTPFTNFVGTATVVYCATNYTGGSGSGTITVTVTAPLVPVFAIKQGTNTLNAQTGLYEQQVTVTNVGTATAAAFRLLVGGLRAGVSLHNATGTNTDGRPYVQYNSPLNPGQFVTLRLEFFVPDRRSFTNSLEAIAVLPAPANTNVSGGVVIDRSFLDVRLNNETRYVIEWTSIPGRTYTVIYSDDNMATWTAATPSVTASANRTQWYDDGPPKTQSKPMSLGSRYYRVILAP